MSFVVISFFWSSFPCHSFFFGGGGSKKSNCDFGGDSRDYVSHRRFANLLVNGPPSPLPLPPPIFRRIGTKHGCCCSCGETGLPSLRDIRKRENNLNVQKSSHHTVGPMAPVQGGCWTQSFYLGPGGAREFR